MGYTDTALGENLQNTGAYAIGSHRGDECGEWQELTPGHHRP